MSELKIHTAKRILRRIIMKTDIPIATWFKISTRSTFTRATAMAALLLAIPAAASSQDAKVSPVEYRKTTLHGNYSAWMPNGIIVGKHGANKDKLVVGSIITNAIRIVDPDSGRIVKEYNPKDWRLLGPDDVSEGPDGTIYHVNAAGTGIGYITPDGKSGVLAEDATQKMWTDGIAVSPDGKTLFFAQNMGEDAVFTLDLTDPNAKAEKIAENVGWNNGSEFGPDGMVYGGNNVYGGVMQWNVKTGIGKTVFHDGMEWVSAVEVNDVTGLLYATEFYLGHVSRIDLENNTRRIIATLPSFVDNVAVEDKPNPRIFATAYAYDTVYEVFENGDPPRVIAQGDGSIPEGIAIIKGKDGDRMFIRDRFRLREYDPTTGGYKVLAESNFDSFIEDRPGAYDLDRINMNNSVKDQVNLHFTRSLHAVGEDKLITAGAIIDQAPGRVVIFDLASNMPERIEKGFKPTTADAIVVGDDIYVANGSVITRVMPDGSRSDVFTGKSPVAFAQSDSGAWVSDRDDGKVLQVAEGDKWLETPRVVVADLKSPQGITVANDGDLLAIEAGTGRLLKVDPDSGIMMVMMENLSAAFSSQLLSPVAQVAQASDGAIYVSEPGASSFSVIRPRY